MLAADGDVPGGGITGPNRLGEVRGPATVVGRSANAADAEVGRRLWDVSEALAETRFPLTARTAAP